jgi:hypothetical protein
MADEGTWFSVRCVFELTSDSRDERSYEERITLWRANDFDAAVASAEAEAAEYAATLSATYLGLAQAFAIAGDVADGCEVFSLIRDSDLPPALYLDAFFDTGAEYQQNKQ